MATVRDLLTYQSGLSRSETRLLLAQTLSLRAEALIMHPEAEVADDKAAVFYEKVKMAAAGYPIPYITGKQAFWSRDFIVSPAVLIPRPDTETLVETALHTIADKPLKILELGTGSGCIAITLALEKPLTTVTATDISSEALAVAKLNAEQFSVKNITFKQGEWFDAVGSDECFDLIVSNPPYIAQGDVHLPALKWEPITALTSGIDGLNDIRRIASEAIFHLAENGILAFEHGYDQGKAARDILLQLGYRSVMTLQDLGGNDRVTKGFAPV